MTRATEPGESHRGWSHTLALPLVSWLFSLSFIGFYALQSYRSYLSTGVMLPRDLPGLLAPVVKDFAALALIMLVGYGRYRWLRAVSLTLASLIFLANAIQLLAMNFSSEFVTPSVVRMSQVIAFAINPTSVISAGAALSSVAIFVVGIRLHGLEQLSRPQRAWAALFVLIPTLSAHGLSRASRIFDLERDHGLDIRRSPTLALIQAIADAKKSEPTEPPPSPEAVDVAAKYGIEVHPEAYAPFVKSTLYKSPFPYARLAAAPTKPNVIVFFVESLSADLLGPYNEARAAMTPNFNDFAAHSLRVDDYVNHTTPTVTALRGQLCSTYPRLSWTPWFEAKSKLKTARIQCLPHLLQEQGYQSIYLSHCEKNDTYMESQFIDFGFQELLFRDRVMTELLPGESPQRDGQPGDDQVFRGTTAYLEKRPADSAPFFLAVSTIETHTGYDSPSKWGDGSNRVLNTFYNLDLAFGRFWSWFKASRFAKDTIVIVTGDHALYPQDLLRRVASPKHLNSKFDRMALMIYDPVHALPSTLSVKTTSIDFAPSIVQLLGIEPARRNAFMGLSMFGDRAGLRGGIGLIFNNSLFYWDGGEPEIVDEHQCQGDACAALAVLRYSQQIEAENRLWTD